MHGAKNFSPFYCVFAKKNIKQVSHWLNMVKMYCDKMRLSGAKG
jgi:hypothetical protein